MSLNSKLCCGLVLLAFLLSKTAGFSQSNTKKYLPQFAPQSPNVASLGKYGEYSVNLFTGQPDISIPLYEIKSGNLSVPITLSYNATGFRYTDQAGFVGLGWSLSSGGMVSRSMQGLADETYQYLSKTTLANRDECNADDRNYLVNLENGVYDGQPDIFSYSFPGKSGKFVLGQNGQEPFIFPYQPIKIGYNLATNNFQDFSIRDDNGDLYKFAPSEHTFNDNGGSSTNLKTAWYLQEMQSANAEDKISFTYQSGGEIRSSEKVSQFTVQDNLLTGTFYGSSQSATELNTYSVVNSLVPQTINFPNGKVVFYVSTYNVDLIKLDKIDIFQVKGNQDILIKSIVFSYSFFQDSHTKQNICLKLNGIEITDKNRAAIQKYNFQYWTNTLTRNYPYAIDYWGFYNGQTGNRDLFTPRTIEFKDYVGAGTSTISFGTASRNPDQTYGKEGVLKRITFPTGGHSEFDYEGNRYLNRETQLAENAGGIRIASIKSYDGINSTPASVKFYKYGQGESGLGEINNPLKRKFYYTEQTVTMNGLDKNDNDSKRVRSYTASPIQASNSFDNSPVVHPFVTEYKGDISSNAGRTQFQFSHYEDLDVDLGSYNGVLYKDFYFWKRGHLENKTVYDASNNIVAATDNVYTILQDTSRLVGAKAFMHRDSEGGIDKICAAFGGQVDEYTYRAYTLKTGAVRLSRSVETIYPGNIQQVTNYTYHPTELQVVEEKKSTSKGEEIITRNKYPRDFKATNSIAAEMHTRNMLSAMMETQTRRGTADIYKLQNIYRSEPNGRTEAPTTNIILSEVKEAPTGGTLETRISFNKYDQSANLMQFTLSDDQPNVYLWGYNNKLPIAEVKNALHNEVMFENFEEGSGWDGNISFSIDKAKTGQYAGLITNNSAGEIVSHATKWLPVSLSAPKKFKYSGWVYSNGPSAQIYLFMKRAGEAGYFSYVDEVSTSAIGKWVYLQKEFLVPADVTQLSLRLDNNGFNKGALVWFDDVRLHPADAQMATFTHSPLTGVRTVTDANNQVSFYDYDNYGRLSSVKDDKGNIIKSYNYQYKK